MGLGIGVYTLLMRRLFRYLSLLNPNPTAIEAPERDIAQYSRKKGQAPLHSAGLARHLQAYQPFPQPSRVQSLGIGGEDSADRPRRALRLAIGCNGGMSGVAPLKLT